MSIQFRTRSRGFGVDPDTLMGACCVDDGCVQTSLRICYDNGGEFFAGKNCKEENPCAKGTGESRSLYGVCCDEHGFCYITTEGECECRNGTWKGKEFDCLSYDCCAGSTAAQQACCMGKYIKGVSGDYSWAGLCKDLKPCECLDLGGVPRGPDSRCSTINSAGGCGVTGATAHGSCCVEGNCHSPDTVKGTFVDGYTAGDCAYLGGLWGGSGSNCSDGTTFSTSWPCAWPTGSCCFGYQPFHGVTYCDSGKTCGDCLNLPPGGSGGVAWIIGATCGNITEIDGVNCIPPQPENKGVCCIPEYFGVEDSSIKPFIVDYSCYVTTENRCISIGGLWSEKEESCDDVDCCSLYQDCTLGPEGSCCQFDLGSGNYVRCDNTAIYNCEQIAINNNNIQTLFYEGEQCDDETGYPCSDRIMTTDSCCLWQHNGIYIGCQNIGENDLCPPTPEYVGMRFDQPCESPGFNCSTQKVGACCHGVQCTLTSRGGCAKLSGIFYEGWNCIDNCNDLPCCSVTDDTVIACYNKDNAPIDVVGADRCLDSWSVPSQHLNKEFAAEYLIDLGIDNPVAVHTNSNPSLLFSCEDCGYGCSRSRGSCCWNGMCVPSRTQEECRQLGGIFQRCEGIPFVNISDSWATENPCIEAGCSGTLRGTEEEYCDEPEDCFGACCTNGGVSCGKNSECPNGQCVGGYCSCIPGGDCDYRLRSECSGCFYGCGTQCCKSCVDPSDGVCCLSGDDGCQSDLDPEQCDAFNGTYHFGSSCDICEGFGATEGSCCYEFEPSKFKCIQAEELACCNLNGEFSAGENCVDNCSEDCSEECISCAGCGGKNCGGEFGACCNPEDGTCQHLPINECCEKNGTMEDCLEKFKPNLSCEQANCPSCVCCDVNVCPDCKPCCMSHSETGVSVCRDMPPGECISAGGTPQLEGTYCNNYISGQYTEGDIYCHYCAWKSAGGEAPSGWEDDYITNLGYVCRACCEGGGTLETCHPLETFQDHIDYDNLECNTLFSTADFCQTDDTIYLPEEWCVECDCQSKGACCHCVSGCAELCQFGEGEGPCSIAGPDDDDSGWTKEDCEDEEGQDGNGGVWLGPGTSCPQGPGAVSCTPHLRPCCTCGGEFGWDDVDNSDGDFGQAGPCPSLGPGEVGDCCDIGEGPGVTDPPWSGTTCQMKSAYTEDTCINWDDTPGYLGIYGDTCGDYGGSANCQTCDDPDFGKGACCSCHRFAFNWPYHPEEDQDWSTHGDRTGDCQGGETKCLFTTKNECDLLNKWGNTNSEAGHDFALGEVALGICDKWDEDYSTIGDYPECDSFPWVHPYPIDSDTWTEPVGTYTWWGPKSNCEVDNEEWDSFDQIERLFVSPCNSGQVCRSWYSNTYFNCYPNSFSPHFPTEDDPYICHDVPFTFCGTNWGQGSHAHRTSSGSWSGDTWHGWKWIPPEWATPDRYYPDDRGTPLKQEGYCDGREPECGTGCPECMLDQFVSHPWWENGHGVWAGYGLDVYERDCRRGCQMFGACCNPKLGVCSRWPQDQCIKLGGYFMGAPRCADICGSVGECMDETTHTYGDSKLWPTHCGTCAVCENVSSAYRNKGNIKYRTFIHGRKDVTATIPFFGFANVETPPIDIPENAMFPQGDANSVLYYKISNSRDLSNPVVEAIPFPTDPTSHQYIQGYSDVNGSYNLLSWGIVGGGEELFKSYRNSIRTLWLTRKHQTPENAELANMFEPYYHSKIEFSEVPNLEMLVINPARYGNGRNEFDENWNSCKNDTTGYYSGVYLTRDISRSVQRGSKLKTLIAADSSIDSGCTPLQYLNLSSIRKLETVHVNNNELYRLDIQEGNKIRELWAQDNKLGSVDGPSWLNSPGFVGSQEEFPMRKLNYIERLIVSDNDIKSLISSPQTFNNLTSLLASNNANLHSGVPLYLDAPSLEYLDLSGCGLEAGMTIRRSSKLKQILLRETHLGNASKQKIDYEHFAFGQNKIDDLINLETIVLTGSRLRFLNLGADTQIEWGDPGVVGEYNNYGYAFWNLTYADLSDNILLTKVQLPSPTDVYSTAQKKHLRYVNVNGTALGESGINREDAPGFDAFFSQSAFINPEGYPVGHVLEVSARNIRDLNGNRVTLSVEKYNEITNLWNGSERFIVLDVDIDK